jgi:ubiquinone/menaquinone biosynthesis C-methylase UbiE
MAWYDVFAKFYDSALEALYLESRRTAVEALQLTAADCVLDVPCGTGQSLSLLAPAVGSDGRVLGVDASAGMLARARARCERERLDQVRLVEGDATRLDEAQVAAALGGARPLTRLHVFLGMSVFPEPETTFERLWSLLAPGGRCVVVDVFAERLGVQGRLVNLMAGADIRREFWQPLERVGSEFSKVDLPYRYQHGGQIMLAQAVKR